MSIRKTILASLAAVLMVSAGAMAQDNPGGANPGGANPGGGNAAGGNNGGGNNGGGRQRGQGGQGGNWDPAQFQQRIMDGIKEQLKAPDDEWKVIEPKLKKVMDASAATRAGGFGFGGRGRGGPQGGDNAEQQPTTELGKAAKELRDLLKTENPTADQITAKLKAYRDARDKANAELKAAREALKEVLTEKQEAQLVLMNTLE
jgi:hypothetical protein